MDQRLPCFIYYRLDTRLSNGSFEWLLITYVPDEAKVRDKMMYAASRQTLIKDLGDIYIVDSLYATDSTEVSFNAYKNHVAHKQASAPLTEKEKELAQARMSEVGAEIGTQSRRAHAAKLMLQIGDTATFELGRFISRKINLIVLQIILPSEKVELNFTESAGSLTVGARNLKSSEPCYILLNFSHPGAQTSESSASVFIYFCPKNASLKQKMVYSCTKQPLVRHLDSIDLKIDHKFEIDSFEDLCDEFLNKEIYNYVKDPSSAQLTESSKFSESTKGKAVHNTNFEKPTKPGRGPAKLIR